MTETGGQKATPHMRYSIFSVNDHYPDRERDVPELYRQVEHQCLLAEDLGYDTFWVAEHHFHEYGVVPNPAVMLAGLAARTRRIRLGSAISILTFHNPLTVSESYAMVDVLSGGRLRLGVGSGYLKHEFEGYGIDGAEKRERFDETLMLLRRLLAGERVTHRGRFAKLEAVALNVLPVQQPLTVHVAILRQEAAYHVGHQGHRMLAVPYASLDSFDQVAGLVAEFRRGREEAGAPAGDDDVALAFHCHVAESDAAARSAAAEAFELYVATRLYARRQTYDDVMRSGLSLFGSVETVVNKLLALHAMGVRHIMLLQNFGLLAPERVEASMRRFATEVMPEFHARLPRPAAATAPG